MKPFTLRWWMNYLDLVTTRYYINLKNFKHEPESNKALRNHYRRFAAKYLKLKIFIEERIINKYGEQDA